jgi:hypothetical protein
MTPAAQHAALTARVVAESVEDARLRGELDQWGSRCRRLCDDALAAPRGPLLRLLMGSRPRGLARRLWAARLRREEMA